MTPAPTDGARLERALELFLATAPASPAAREQLLQQHPALADLLAPMLGLEPPATEPTTPGVAAEGEPDARVLGDFRLVRELGRGGMGVVYEAWQRSLDRRVAVKTLGPASCGSPSAIARFRREASAAGRLGHPHIVEVYGFGSDGDQHFFAMQFVDGRPLHHCRERYREPAQALGIVRQLADALAHAHAHGLVHRDVKPANVLVQADGKVLLTDFGVARDAALPTMTQDGGFLGTLDYASPEQIRGDAVDGRTDLWSLGVLWYELLAGVLPFAAATREAILHQILTAEPPPLCGRPGISDDLAAVLDRMLTKHLPHRYASAAALLTDLHALAEGSPVSARLPTTLERLQRWARREPWRAVAAATLGLGLPTLTAVGGYLWANAPRIAAATAAEAREDRENRLASAWETVTGSPTAAGLELLAPLSIDREVACTRAWLLASQGQRERALAILTGFDDPTSALLRNWLQPAAGEPTTDLATDRPADAFDAFLRGMMMRSQGVRSGDLDPAADLRVLRLLQQSTLLSPVPRLPFLVAQADAAARCDDHAAASLVERALAIHFPDLPQSRRARLRLLSDLAPAAALQLFASMPAAEQQANEHDHAVALERLRRLPEAVTTYRSVLARDPRRFQTWCNLSAVLRKSKQHDEATAAARRAIELAPEREQSWNTLGLALRDAGDVAGAAAAFTQAMAVGPKYGSSAYNLGNLHAGQGDHAAAVLAFEQAAARDPNEVRHWANLANSLKKLGRNEAALMASLRACGVAPNDLIPHFNLSQTALDAGLPLLALQAAERTVAIAAGDANAQFALAAALLAQAEVDAPAALAAARRADELAQGKSLEPRLLLVRALQRSGDGQAAGALLATIADDPRWQTPAARARIDKVRQQLGR